MKTVKVKFLSSISSDAGSFHSGQLVNNLPAEVAAPWIDQKICELQAEKAPMVSAVEATTLEPVIIKPAKGIAPRVAANKTKK